MSEAVTRRGDDSGAWLRHMSYAGHINTADSAAYQPKLPEAGRRNREETGGDEVGDWKFDFEYL